MTIYKLYRKKGYQYFLMFQSKKLDEVTKKMKELIERTDIPPEQLIIYSGSSPIHSILGGYEYD